MVKYILSILLVVLSIFNLCAQSVLPSTTFINTKYNNKECFANENASNLFYNEQTHELYIIVDFKACEVGQDSMDVWLDDLDESKLIFKTVIHTDKLLQLTNGNSKTYTVNGKVKFNNILSEQTIDVTFFEISKEGMLYRNNGNDYYDRIRANFQITLNPKSFKIDSKEHHLKNKISISIGSGYVNQFKPGMESWFDGGL